MRNIFNIIANLIFGGFFAAFVVLIGGVLAYMLVLEVRAPIGTYVPIEATITSSELIESAHYSSGRVAVTKSFDVVITYSYTVDGQEYQSIPLYLPTYEPLSTGRAEAEAVYAAHPVGGTMTVYYNPASPDDSRLEAGRSWGKIIGLSVILLVLLYGVFYVFARRSWR